MVLAVCGSNDFNQRLRSEKLIVADFTANWCPPCRQIAPKLAAIEHRYEDRVCILKVDVDECSNLTNSYHVNSMPTFIFIKKGREVDRFTGADAALLEKKIKLYS